MKTKHLFIMGMQLACFALAGLTLTSCLDDDDDDDNYWLTGTELQQAYAMVAGTHTGKMVFVKDTIIDNQQPTDTATVTWTFTSDTTMVISGIPARAFAQNLTSNQDELKAALLQQPTKDLQCDIRFYKVSPVLFIIAPRTMTYYLTYGGEEHTVDMAFYLNYSYSFGNYNPSNTTGHKFTMYILHGAVWVDKTSEQVNPTNYINSTEQFQFYQD